jgi:hypothetical protein
MANESLLGRNGNEPTGETTATHAEDGDVYLTVQEMAEKFNVTIHAVYKSVRLGFVNVKQKKRVMLISLKDYRSYHEYAKKFWRVTYEGREPDEQEREVLRLKAAGMSDTAIALQVYGYVGGSSLIRIQGIWDAYGDKNKNDLTPPRF